MKIRTVTYLKEFLIGLLFGLFAYMYFLAMKNSTFSLTAALSFVFAPAFTLGIISFITTTKSNLKSPANYKNTIGGSKKANFYWGFFSGLFFGFWGFLLYGLCKEGFNFSLLTLLMGLKWGIIVGLILGFILALDRGIPVNPKNNILSKLLENKNDETKITLPKEIFSKYYGLLSIIASFISLLIVFNGISISNLSYYLISMSTGLSFGIKAVKKKEYLFSCILGWIGILIAILGFMLRKIA